MTTLRNQRASIVFAGCCSLGIIFSFSVAAAGSGIHNVIDCSQYAQADLDKYPDERARNNCSDWAKSRGYSDGVITPMDGAADAYTFENKPLTCPKINPGNVGFYCVGLDKKI